MASGAPLTLDDSSLFQRRLSQALSSMDPAWRSAFIDYEKLRKQVKKIVFVQQQEAVQRQQAEAAAQQQQHQQQQQAQAQGQSAAASSSSSSSSSAAVLHAALAQQKARTGRYHSHFHASLQQECLAMNAFFQGRAAACTKLFDELGLDHAAIQHQQVHPVATLTFSKVLLDTFPSNANRVLSLGLSHQAASTSMAALEPRQIALFKRFLHLCYEIDQLRKYVLINHAILWKVVKKYDKHAGQDTAKAFVQLLQQFEFSGEECSRLVGRAQYVSKRLLQSEEDERKGTCPICLRAPMVDPLALSCLHSFCFTCLLHQPTFGSACPMCRKEDDWDAHLLGIEGIMTDAIVQCVSTPREGPSPSSATPIPPGTPTPLSPSAVVARALQMNGVGTALQNMPGYLHEAVFTAASNAAVAAVTALNRGGGAAPTADPQNGIQAAVNAAIRAQMGQWNHLGSMQPRSPHPAANGTDMGFNSPAASSMPGLSPVPNPSALDDGSTLTPAAWLQQLIRKAKHVKQSAGVSCHQCKTTKNSYELHFCTSQILVSRKGRRRKCRKKYCETLATAATQRSCPCQTTLPALLTPPLTVCLRRCLRRSYTPSVMETALANPKQWPCPSCLNLCICAACHRQDGGESEDDGDGDEHSVSSAGTRKSGGAVKAEASPVQAAAPVPRKAAQRKRKELDMQTAFLHVKQMPSPLLSPAGELTSSLSAVNLQMTPVKDDGEEAHEQYMQEAALHLYSSSQPRMKSSKSSPALSAAAVPLSPSNGLRPMPASGTSPTSSSTPNLPSEALRSPGANHSDLPGLEVVSPPSSACSKSSDNSHGRDGADCRDDIDPASQDGDDGRSSKAAKRWDGASPRHSDHSHHAQHMSTPSSPRSNGIRLNIPTSTSAINLHSASSLSSPAFSSGDQHRGYLGSAATTAGNSPGCASNATSPTNTTAAMFAAGVEGRWGIAVATVDVHAAVALCWSRAPVVLVSLPLGCAAALPDAAAGQRPLPLVQRAHERRGEGATTWPPSRPSRTSCATRSTWPTPAATAAPTPSRSGRPSPALSPPSCAGCRCRCRTRRRRRCTARACHTGEDAGGRAFTFGHPVHAPPAVQPAAAHVGVAGRAAAPAPRQQRHGHAVAAAVLRRPAPPGRAVPSAVRPRGRRLRPAHHLRLERPPPAVVVLLLTVVPTTSMPPSPSFYATPSAPASSSFPPPRSDDGESHVRPLNENDIQSSSHSLSGGDHGMGGWGAHGHDGSDKLYPDLFGSEYLDDPDQMASFS